MIEPVFTVEDLPYCVEYDGRTIYVFGLCGGEPTDREIYHRKIYRMNHGPNHLAIAKTCPMCGHNNTEWIREDGNISWNVCFDCEIAFEDEEFIDLSECEE